MSNFHTELIRRVRLDGIPARQQGTCKHVLGWIAFHASEEEADIAYPGIETLELETGMRAKAIVNATETLAAHEWITKKRRNGTSNIYRLNVRKIREHHVPKGPSKVTKLIDELPGLGFSHETDAGSDAEPNTGEPGAHTSENTHPQASDQHLCSENTSDVFSEHVGDVLTTRPGCSHDNQTVRDPSATHHQPATAAVDESATTESDGSGDDGWLEGSAKEEDNPEGHTGGESGRNPQPSSELDTSAGALLLHRVERQNTAHLHGDRTEHIRTINDALAVLSRDVVTNHLGEGLATANTPPGALVERIRGLPQKVVNQQAQQAQRGERDQRVTEQAATGQDSSQTREPNEELLKTLVGDGAFVPSRFRNTAGDAA